MRRPSPAFKHILVADWCSDEFVMLRQLRNQQTARTNGGDLFVYQKGMLLKPFNEALDLVQLLSRKVGMSVAK